MRRIVVGVDGSPGSAAALAWALKLAAETSAEVEAVLAWTMDNAWIDKYLLDMERLTAKARAAEGDLLDQAIADVVHNLSRHVEITRTVAEGQPARVLLDRSKDADLLVVGSRGRGGFTGLLLGSVSQQCVNHARVPLVVVPQPE